MSACPLLFEVSTHVCRQVINNIYIFVCWLSANNFFSASSKYKTRQNVKQHNKLYSAVFNSSCEEKSIDQAFPLYMEKA